MKLLFAMLATLLLLPLSARAEVDFVKEIKPLIESSCIKCHSGPKPKGGLSMETLAGLVKGGNEGMALVPGKSADSKIFTFMTLPKTDDMRMPPDGEPLAKAVSDKMKAWIDEGAKWPEGVVIKGPTKEKPKVTVDDTGLPISPAEKAAVEKLEKAGAFVMRLAQNTNWLRVDFTHRGKDVKDDELILLKDCPNLVELNLGGLAITDAQMVHLKPLVNLNRLQLHRTKVTDAGIAELAGLNKLVSLNLYETAITDVGIQQLKDCKALKKLYVWQTKVTEGGAKQLAGALTGIDINRGYELPPETKKEEPKKADPKKDEPKKNDPKKEEPKKEEPKKKK